jgi:hypothetical protein
MAATVGWTRIATDTERRDDRLGSPLRGHDAAEIGVGLPQTWSPPQTVSMIRIGSRLILSAPQDVDRQPVAVQVEQLARMPRWLPRPRRGPPARPRTDAR